MELWPFFEAFAPQEGEAMLFLGEEGADLSRCAAESYLRSRVLRQDARVSIMKEMSLMTDGVRRGAGL